MTTRRSYEGMDEMAARRAGHGAIFPPATTLPLVACKVQDAFLHWRTIHQESIGAPMVANQPERAENEAGAAGMESGMPPATRVPVVGLGGAGGALPALRTFFRHVPEAPGVA